MWGKRAQAQRPHHLPVTLRVLCSAVVEAQRPHHPRNMAWAAASPATCGQICPGCATRAGAMPGLGMCLPGSAHVASQVLCRRGPVPPACSHLPLASGSHEFWEPGDVGGAGSEQREVFSIHLLTFPFPPPHTTLRSAVCLSLREAEHPAGSAPLEVPELGRLQQAFGPGSSPGSRP